MTNHNISHRRITDSDHQTLIETHNSQTTTQQTLFRHANPLPSCRRIFSRPHFLCIRRSLSLFLCPPPLFFHLKLFCLLGHGIYITTHPYQWNQRVLNVPDDQVQGNRAATLPTRRRRLDRGAAQRSARERRSPRLYTIQCEIYLRSRRRTSRPIIS